MRLTLSGHCPTTCAPGSYPQSSAAQSDAPVCKSPEDTDEGGPSRPGCWRGEQKAEGHRPPPRRDKQDHGRRGFEPHSELGSPVAERQDIQAMGLPGPGHSSHCFNLKLLALQ